MNKDKLTNILCPHEGFIGSPEEDLYRSSYIQWLLHQNNYLLENSKIPRVVIQYWDDSNNIPDDVKLCLESWNPLVSKGFTIKLFDDIKARVFIQKHLEIENLQAFNACYHPAMKCDYFRLCYIYTMGGFYVDADERYTGLDIDHLFNDNLLKIQSLCYDLKNEKMVDSIEYYNDLSHSTDKIFYLNNNPLISPPKHKLLKLALKRSTNILLNNSRPEIQSTTGPGNLSASIVSHSEKLRSNNKKIDFKIIKDWNDISICVWFLSYRNDERNWRLIKI